MWFVALAFATTSLRLVVAAEVTPVEQRVGTWPLFHEKAHSHNDYRQKRPLLDAVEAGLSSIEVDLWLEGGKPLVGHDHDKWRGEFEALYLQPLTQLWKESKIPDRGDRTFLLWLDIKDRNPDLRSSLHQLLEAQEFIRSADPAGVRIEVVLTGNKQAKEAYVQEYPSARITRDSNLFREDDPPGSDNWRWYALDWKKLSTWDGLEDMPAEDRDRLHLLVSKIHAKERKLRLWGHPSTLRFWREAVAAGVDRIGTDVIPESSSKMRSVAE